MLGAILGDILGSQFEAQNVKYKNFELFPQGCNFTDDSVMTCATAAALFRWDKSHRGDDIHKCFVEEFLRIGNLYVNIGYGPTFRKWILGQIPPVPYNSYGNGSAMRVSPIGWFATSLEETLWLAKASAEVTHNHPDGIAGAQATAASIFMARNNFKREQIKQYISNNFYSLDFTIDEIRESYQFDVSCRGSVPQAIKAFLEGDDYEDSIRNAISIGGDSDTIAAITGGIAEAFWGIPQHLKDRAMTFLPENLMDIVIQFRKFIHMD